MQYITKVQHSDLDFIEGRISFPSQDRTVETAISTVSTNVTDTSTALRTTTNPPLTLNQENRPPPGPSIQRGHKKGNRGPNHPDQPKSTFRDKRSVFHPPPPPRKSGDNKAPGLEGGWKTVTSKRPRSQSRENPSKF